MSPRRVASLTGAFAELFRSSPTSFPFLQGKVLLATVVPRRGGDKFVSVDSGWKAHSTLLRTELGASGAGVQPGDRVALTVEHVETPLGEAAMSSERARESVRTERVWAELADTRARDGLVQGRILNAVNGGYAVGVAGTVAFLPAARTARPEVAGNLAPYEIIALNEATRNMVLSSPPLWKVARQGQAGAGGRQQRRLPFDSSRVVRTSSADRDPGKVGKAAPHTAAVPPTRKK